MELIGSYVKTILAGMVVIKLLSFLLPDCAYERYYRPVASIALVFCILRPLGKLQELGTMCLGTVNQILSECVEAQYEDGYEQLVLKEYRNRIQTILDRTVEETGNTLRKVELTLSEEDSPGRIQSICLWISTGTNRDAAAEAETIRGLISGQLSVPAKDIYVMEVEAENGEEENKGNRD